MTEPKRPSDRLTKIDSGERVPVGMPVITQHGTHALCSCGQPFVQPRRKVREEAIQRHLNAKHGGQGLWL